MNERQSAKSLPSIAHRNTQRLGIAERVQEILAMQNLTLRNVSIETRRRFPTNSLYHVPHNFYFQLRSAGLSPTFHQVLALASLSGYRIVDWLEVFGFRLDDIPRFGAALSRERTTLLDAKIYDPDEELTWFRARPTASPLPAVAPLSLLLETSGPRRLSSLLPTNGRRFLYAKIGCLDTYAFPDLVPGSIVRANVQSIEHPFSRSTGRVADQLFLVETSKGCCCCRLYFATNNRVVLTATQLPFAQVELRLGSEGRILGALDLEFRPLPTNSACALPDVAPDLAKLWQPAPLELRGADRRPAVFLRTARLRAGLSFRKASELSREIAKELRDERYFTSPGALSDYEAQDVPPRHIHKLFTLSILYSIDIGELVSAFGVAFDDQGRIPIPNDRKVRNELADSQNLVTGRASKPRVNGFTRGLLKRFLEIPFFLRNSLESLSGLPHVSLRDVFWVGGQMHIFHPALSGAQFVIVDRRQKRPMALRRKSLWEQPLYLLRKRNGCYVLAACSVEDAVLVLHPHSDKFIRPERFRNHVDAEVVGRIVGVIRSLVASA